MVETFNIEKIPQHAINMWRAILNVVPFIKEHKLWKGFLENKWVTVVTVVIAVLFSYWLISDLIHYFNPSDIPIDSSDVDAQDIESKKEAITQVNKGSAVSSGSRYLLLILLEVVIFHFSVKTLSILKRQKQKPSFREFVTAERRMIKLLVISFFKGLAASIVISIILSIFGVGWLSSTIMFLVYSYFMGYAFLDNYNEQFEINMKNSLLKVRQHVGAATLLGVVVSGLIYIPILGPILAPIFGSVAATIYGHRYQVQKVNS